MPQLTWLGDDNAERAARRVPYRQEKQTIGEVWASASNRRCLFKLVTDPKSAAGRSVAEQLQSVGS